MSSEIAEAVREACAKVCEARITLPDGTIETRHPVELETWKCAQAIRALDLAAITNAATAAPTLKAEDSVPKNAESLGARSLRHPTPETDAFYGELHPDAHLLEHARSLERRLQEAQRERDEAVAMLRVIGEECVLAVNLPGGDRTVSLTRVRQMIRERDAALREVEAVAKSMDAAIRILNDTSMSHEDRVYEARPYLHSRAAEAYAALAEKGEP